MKVQPKQIIPPRLNGNLPTYRSGNVRKGSRVTAPRERRDATRAMVVRRRRSFVTKRGGVAGEARMKEEKGKRQQIHAT